MKNTIRTLIHLGNQVLIYHDTLCTIYQNVDSLSDIKYSNHELNKIEFHNYLMSMVSELAMLKTCSIIDEYNNGFLPTKYPEYSDRIFYTRKLLKPIFKKINKWSDLKNYRNYVIAHHFKIKDEYLIADNAKTNFNIPSSLEEIILLCHLIWIIIYEIQNQFSEIINQVDDNETLMDYMVIPENNIKPQQEIIKVINEIEKIRSS